MVDIAQSAEREVVVLEVAGSSPVIHPFLRQAIGGRPAAGVMRNRRRHFGGVFATP